MKLRLNLLLMFFCFVFISPALAETLPSTVPEAVGLSSERLGLIDAALSADIEKRICQPPGMTDTGFNVSESDLNRGVYMNPKTFLYTDISKPTISFSGGGGAVSTTMDYANFAQMLLNRGSLNGTRLLGPETVAQMSSDHLGPLGNRPDRGYTPGVGFGNGFGYQVRVAAGAPFLGSVGEHYKGGYGGTCFRSS